MDALRFVCTRSMKDEKETVLRLIYRLFGLFGCGESLVSLRRATEFHYECLSIYSYTKKNHIQKNLKNDLPFQNGGQITDY